MQIYKDFKKTAAPSHVGDIYNLHTAVLKSAVSNAQEDLSLKRLKKGWMDSVVYAVQPPHTNIHTHIYIY